MVLLSWALIFADDQSLTDTAEYIFPIDRYRQSIEGAAYDDTYILLNRRRTWSHQYICKPGVIGVLLSIIARYISIATC